MLPVTYAVTLTFGPLTLNHVLAVTCWNSVLNLSEIDQCTHLRIENLGAVGHLGFQGRWISTIAWPLGTSNEPAYQI